MSDVETDIYAVQKRRYFRTAVDTFSNNELTGSFECSNNNYNEYKEDDTSKQAKPHMLKHIEIKLFW